MNNQRSTSSKVPPFLPPQLDDKNGRQGKVSQRGLLSLVTMIISLLSLSGALGGGLKFTLDILGPAKFDFKSGSMWAEVITLGLAFGFAWITGVLSIRVFNNLILPILIKIISWCVLLGVCILYVTILQRLYNQEYQPPNYFSYLLLMGGGLVVLVGLHLILEGHDLRPYSIPLMLMAMAQLLMIVVRYVFIPTEKWQYVVNDIAFFGVMITVSTLMLAHRGLLNPFRNFVTRFFDQNSHTLRPKS